MSRHRLEPPRPVRPRVGRIAAAAVSVVVTMVALLGFVGLIPTGSSPTDSGRATVASSRTDGTSDGSGTPAGTTTPSAGDASRSLADRTATGAQTQVAAPGTGSVALPARSGSGRRVIFSKSAQRVWLVDAQGKVDATYLVSGSVTNNLGPGKYDVYSKSRWAVGIDDSGVMQYFVRFAHGPNAAIGFHSIPTKNGVPLQTEA